MKKTILITLAEDIVARNIFTKSFWGTFLTNNESQIVLLVQEGKKDFFLSRLPSELIIEEYKRGKTTRFESLVNSLARSGINSHTNLWSKMRSLKRGDSSLSDTLWKRFLAAMLGNFDWYHNFLRFLLLRVKPDLTLSSYYDKYLPEIVFVTSLSNYDFDVPVAREAKRRGLKLIGMGRSWDNFSSHGLLRIVPDELLLQNQFLVDMAEKFQSIYKKDVPMTVVGLPHYDVVSDLQKIIEPREKFLPRIGLNPNEKYILYGAMGSFLFIHEPEMPNVFETIIKEGKINCNKVVYRAHPKFKMESPKRPFQHVVFDVSGEYVVGDKDGLDDNIYLINSIYHSELVITGASTMAQDASFLNKPFICVAFNGNTIESDVDYYESVKRFYDLYTHFEDLVKTGDVKVAFSKEELIIMINKYLDNLSLDTEGRKKIIERFAYKLDGKASERVANYLKEKLKLYD